MERSQVYVVNDSCVRSQLVDRGGDLGRLQGIITRNKKADCYFSLGDLTGQVLDVAHEALRQANVFDAEFSDGTVCRFIRYGGRMSIDQAVAIGDNPSNTIEGDLDPIIEAVGGERIDAGNFRIGV